eukprot:NP_508392.2 SWimming Induced Paralysis [Caenorhabditis elegans]
MLFHFLIAINFVLHFSSATDYIISKQDIKQLDEWDLKVLRDFVRGRGRPIVERIPLDLEDGPDFKEPDQDFELIDFSSPMISQGGMFAAPSNKKAEMFPIPLTPPQPITQIITPASKRKPKPPPKPPQLVEDKPSVEDYEQLASMIQMFIDRRSHKKNGDQALQNNAKSKKKSGEVLGNNAPKSQEVYETRMKELSTELTKILKQLEGTKLEKQPEVHVLRNGSAEQTIDGQYTFIASITLVKDGDKSILVDTGLGTNINARTELIKSLEMHGLSPADVDIVVSTHGHPDHVGGVHDFPDALHYHGWYSHQRTKFNLTALFENDTMNLSENVMLVKCRGHTSDDIGVVVRGVKRRGDVLVSGDLFMREEDIDHPMMWQPLSADVIAQRDSRRRYGCIVDWIVPGHGSMFQVTTNVKKALKC